MTVLHHARLEDAVPTIADDSVDAVVTDTPYELGFMGKSWDRSGVSFKVETWRDIYRVLKPGGHLLAFGGTRTHHRMVCAIEDAGFEIRDEIDWVFGSGFPKSSNQDGEWDGWGTALKPAKEPICLARKPLVGTVPENLAAHRVGALHIDACRIPSQGGRARDGEPSQDRSYADRGATNFAARPGPRGGDPAGRWPANLCHDGSPEVVACFPAEAGAFAPVRGTEPSAKTKSIFGQINRQAENAFHADSGSAARFFGSFQLDANDVTEAKRMFYCAKASRADRDAGCDGMEKRALNWSSGEANPGSFQSPNTDRSARNFHPTVKPTALMRWLCRLITPAGGTILDPFMGSGSTGRGAVLEGFNFIGIEMTAEYLPIARARIADAERQKTAEEAEAKAAAVQQELPL